MSAAVLLAENPKPTDTDIDEAMGGKHLPVRYLSANSKGHSQGRRAGERAEGEMSARRQWWGDGSFCGSARPPVAGCW